MQSSYRVKTKNLQNTKRCCQILLELDENAQQNLTQTQKLLASASRPHPVRSVQPHISIQSSRGMTFSPTRAPGTRQLWLTFFLWVPACIKIARTTELKAGINK